MLNYPKSKITQISSTLAIIDGLVALVTVALCEDGTVWQISRNLTEGTFFDDLWEQYPTEVAQ